MHYITSRNATVHNGDPDHDGRPFLDCGTRLGAGNRLSPTNRPVNCDRCLAVAANRTRYIEAVHNGGTSLGKHQTTQPVAVARWDEREEEWGVFGYDRSTGTYWDRYGVMHYDDWAGKWFVWGVDPVDQGRRLVYPKGVDPEAYWPHTDVRAPRGTGGHAGFVQAVSALLGRPPYGHEYYRIDRRVAPMGRAA